eukprot:SAG11_NODE_3338_length_2515_cov_48.563328_2_plen_122_part_00
MVPGALSCHADPHSFTISTERRAVFEQTRAAFAAHGLVLAHDAHDREVVSVSRRQAAKFDASAGGLAAQRADAVAYHRSYLGALAADKARTRGPQAIVVRALGSPPAYWMLGKAAASLSSG